MQHKTGELKIAREWLNRARGNFARASQEKPKEAYWEDLCFDTHQAAEKALKALMICKGLKFTFTHDLASLLEQLSDGGIHAPSIVKAAASLTEYAVQTRYPGWGEPVTEQDYRQAIAASKSVLEWVEGLFG